MVTGYTRTQIVLHWLVFLFVVLQFVLHDPMSAAWHAVQRGTEIEFNPLVAQHVFGGILILLLVVMRLVIKSRRGAPALQEDEPPLLKFAANATHLGLYGLLILVPLSGIAAWFGGIDLAAEAHEIMKSLMLILILLHIAGALYQHFVLKSDVMTRMRKPQA